MTSLSGFSDVKCFLLEPTDQVDRKLRRYVSPSNQHPEIPRCPLMEGDYSYHDVTVDLDVVTKGPDVVTSDNGWPKDDPRWPTACGCGFVLPEWTVKQLFCETLWRRVDTGELMTLRNAPPGAMYDAHWFHDHPEYCGPDGKCMTVVCPGRGVWMIDSRASNCTMPNDNQHKCWVRHGTPPLLTVDKDGLTCQAGGGSILTHNWHGFLTNGILSESRSPSGV